MTYPFFRFTHRVPRRAGVFRMGQMLRDTSLLLCQLPSCQLNRFLSRLDYHDFVALQNTMDVVHANLLQLQPGGTRTRLIMNAPTFTRATEEEILDRVAQVKPDHYASVRERDLMQRLCDFLCEACESDHEQPKSNRNLLSVIANSLKVGTANEILKHIFKKLDNDGDGVITKREFKRGVTGLLEDKISKEEIKAAFGVRHRW